MLKLTANRKGQLGPSEVSGMESLEGYTPKFSFKSDTVPTVTTNGQVSGMDISFAIPASVLDVAVGYYRYDIVLVNDTNSADIIPLEAGDLLLEEGVYGT